MARVAASNRKARAAEGAASRRTMAVRAARMMPEATRLPVVTSQAATTQEPSQVPASATDEQHQTQSIDVVETIFETEASAEMVSPVQSPPAQPDGAPGGDTLPDLTFSNPAAIEAAAAAPPSGQATEQEEPWHDEPESVVRLRVADGGGWEGMLRGGVTVPLEALWVRRNFTSTFRRLVRNNAKAWHHIPIGNARSQPEGPTPTGSDPDGPLLFTNLAPSFMPAIRFTQGTRPLCLGFSLASAIHHFYCPQLAKHVADWSTDAVMSPDALMFMHDFARSDAMPGWTALRLKKHNPLEKMIPHPVSERETRPCTDPHPSPPPPNTTTTTSFI